MTRVMVDRARCASTGGCEMAAPEVFEIDDDGVLTLLDPSPAPTEQLRIAVGSCPTGALRLVD